MKAEAWICISHAMWLFSQGFQNLIMPYQKKMTNRSSPFYRREMVERILVDISTEYVVTLAKPQNPDTVRLSGLISSEDAQ